MDSDSPTFRVFIRGLNGLSPNNKYRKYFVPESDIARDAAICRHCGECIANVYELYVKHVELHEKYDSLYTISNKTSTCKKCSFQIRNHILTGIPLEDSMDQHSELHEQFENECNFSANGMSCKACGVTLSEGLCPFRKSNGFECARDALETVTLSEGLRPFRKSNGFECARDALETVTYYSTMSRRYMYDHIEMHSKCPPEYTYDGYIFKCKQCTIEVMFCKTASHTMLHKTFDAQYTINALTYVCNDCGQSLPHFTNCDIPIILTQHTSMHERGIAMNFTMRCPEIKCVECAWSMYKFNLEELVQHKQLHDICHAEFGCAFNNIPFACSETPNKTYKCGWLCSHTQLQEWRVHRDMITYCQSHDDVSIGASTYPAECLRCPEVRLYDVSAIEHHTTLHSRFPGQAIVGDNYYCKECSCEIAPHNMNLHITWHNTFFQRVQRLQNNDMWISSNILTMDDCEFQCVCYEVLQYSMVHEHLQLHMIDEFFVIDGISECVDCGANIENACTQKHITEHRSFDQYVGTFLTKLPDAVLATPHYHCNLCGADIVVPERYRNESLLWFVKGHVDEHFLPSRLLYGRCTRCNVQFSKSDQFRKHLSYCNASADILRDNLITVPTHLLNCKTYNLKYLIQLDENRVRITKCSDVRQHIALSMCVGMYDTSSPLSLMDQETMKMLFSMH